MKSTDVTLREMGKEIFTAINQQANSEVSFFKFEPSRDITPSTSPLTIWTWDVSINLAYGTQSLKFSQSFNYKNTISYSGRLRRLVPASMTLAATCNEASKNLFQDLGNINEPSLHLPKLMNSKKD